jgi:hypothetical protein
VWSRRGSSPRIVMLLCGEENLCEVAKAPGAVMSYGPNQIDMWKRACGLAFKHGAAGGRTRSFRF